MGKTVEDQHDYEDKTGDIPSGSSWTCGFDATKIRQSERKRSRGRRICGFPWIAV